MLRRCKSLLYFLGTTPILLGAVSAFVLANVMFEQYHWFVHHEVHLGAFTMNLHALTNEVLMAAFFLYAAAEVRESLLPNGVLHGFKRAALPLVATAGGIAGPAILYVIAARLFASEHTNGWVVVTATDIAFAVTVAGLVYGDVKHPAVKLLLTIAVLDDAVGMVLIPTVYADGVNWLMLIATVAYAVAVPFVLRRLGARQYLWYIVLAGVPSWYMFHTLGVEPAMALVPIVFGMPHAKTDDGLFAEQAETINHEVHHLQHTQEPTEHSVRPARGSSLEQMGFDLNRMMWPVMLLFGFANAGVQIGSAGALTAIVLCALVAGKIAGIVGATRLGMACKLELPAGTSNRDLWVIGAAASIGFTVSLFVAGIALSGAAADAARIGALLSLVAGAALTFAYASVAGIRRTKHP